MLKFRDFLATHHGPINKIILSYAKSDSPAKMGKEYLKWFNETNKEFEVDMDLQHTDDKLESFAELQPYLDLNVACWDLFQKDSQIILEVDLNNIT